MTPLWDETDKQPHMNWFQRRMLFCIQCKLRFLRKWVGKKSSSPTPSKKPSVVDSTQKGIPGKKRLKLSSPEVEVTTLQSFEKKAGEPSKTSADVSEKKKSRRAKSSPKASPEVQKKESKRTKSSPKASSETPKKKNSEKTSKEVSEKEKLETKQTVSPETPDKKEVEQTKSDSQDKSVKPKAQQETVPPETSEKKKPTEQQSVSPEVSDKEEKKEEKPEKPKAQQETVPPKTPEKDSQPKEAPPEVSEEKFNWLVARQVIVVLVLGILCSLFLLDSVAWKAVDQMKETLVKIPSHYIWWGLGIAVGLLLLGWYLKDADRRRQTYGFYRSPWFLRFGIILLFLGTLFAGYWYFYQITEWVEERIPTTVTKTQPSKFSSTSISQLPADIVLPIIAKCESGGRQFDSHGNVITNLKTMDVGKWQINLGYHSVEAKRLGIDLYTEEGNEKFARILFARNDTRDWSASRYCWEPKLLALGILPPSQVIITAQTFKMVIGVEWTDPISIPLGKNLDWGPVENVAYEVEAKGKIYKYPRSFEGHIRIPGRVTVVKIRVTDEEVREATFEFVISPLRT